MKRAKACCFIARICLRWKIPLKRIGKRCPMEKLACARRKAPLRRNSAWCSFRMAACFAYTVRWRGSGAFAYSRDMGRSWTQPAFMRYPDGRRMKHPRAANFVWKLQNGDFLYWFHNQGGCGYDGRNPAWVSLGREYDAPDGRRIAWSDRKFCYMIQTATCASAIPI